MKHESEIVKLDSIDAYNKLYGLETKHPLVTVINLTEATRVVNHVRMDYGIYAPFLKNGANSTLKFGGIVSLIIPNVRRNISRQMNDGYSISLDRIKEEIEHPVDKHTGEIVASHIQVLLDYVTRFYERQFITRRKVNSDILSRFQSSLKNYLETGISSNHTKPLKFFLVSTFAEINR